jgi:sugar phosphate permease
MIEKNSRYAWFIWALGASFFFFEYIVRVSPGVLVNELSQSFHINAYEIGLLSSAFSLSYISMQIPVGTLVDKFSVRWLIGFMALLCAASTWLFSLTSTFHLAVLSRFLIGVTGAFAFVGALKIATLYFSPKHFGFLAGTTQALGMLGASAGVGPLSVVVAKFGWRPTLVSLGFVIAVLAVLIIVLVKDKASSIATRSPVTHSLFSGILAVFKNPYTWLNVLIVGLLYAPTMVFGELWGPLYLARVYNLTSIQSATVVSIIFIGWALGSPFWGWYSDTIQRRKPIIVGSSVFSLIFLVFILYGGQFLSFTVLSVMAFFYGFSNVGVATCYAVACELNPAHYSGTALGFTNMASILLGAIFQPAIGKLLDYHWSGQLVDGVRFYTGDDLKATMVALPLCLVLCAVMSCFLKESYSNKI